MENVPINKPNESEIKPFDLDKLDNELKHTEEFNNSDNSEEQTAELTNDVPEKKRNKLALKIGAAAVAVALVVVGGYQSIKMMTKPAEEVANTQGNRTQTESTQASNVTSEKEQSELTTKPVESTYASSSSNEATGNKVEVDANTNTATNEENNVNTTETEKTGEQLSSSLEIPAGLSSEEYGYAVVNALELWRNAGYLSSDDDAKLMEDWMNYESVSLSEFSASKATEYAKTFSQALFVANYEQNANLVKEYSEFKDMNANSIHAHIKSELDKANRDGFYMSIEPLSVDELFDNKTERSVEIVFSESINIEDLTSSNNELKQTNGKPVTCIVTSTNDGKTEKISNFVWGSDVK